MHINISTSSAIFRWRPACWLRVTGADAASFLQGQFSNDLRALGSTESVAVYGLWLTVKGKVLADSFVIRGGDVGEFWVGSYFSSAVTIRERLEAYVIADDVMIEDQTAEWAAVCVIGDEGKGGWRVSRTKDAVTFRGRRGVEAGRECVFREAAGMPADLGRLAESARVLTAEEMERLRIAAGVPAVPADAGPEDLPQEAGLDADAVSHGKGCYLGQEVMARIKAMGQVRRRLLRVQGIEGAAPAVPAPIFLGGRQVGEVRSAVASGDDGWIGLAMLSLIQGNLGAGLALAADGSGAVRLVDRP